MHIANNDLPKVKAKICQALSTINDGAKRCDLEVDIGDDINPLIITAYQVKEILRIDLRIKNE